MTKNAHCNQGNVCPTKKHRKGTVCPNGIKSGVLTKSSFVAPTKPLAHSESKIFTSKHREEGYVFSRNSLYGTPWGGRDIMNGRNKEYTNFNVDPLIQGESYNRMASENFRNAVTAQERADIITHQLYAQKVDYHLGLGCFAFGDPQAEDSFEVIGGTPEGLEDKLRLALESNGYDWPKGRIEIESKDPEINSSDVAMAMFLALRSNDKRQLPNEWTDAHIASTKPNKVIRYEAATLNDDGSVKIDLESIPLFALVSIMSRNKENEDIVENAGTWRGNNRLTSFGGFEVFFEDDNWEVISAKALDKN